MTKIKLPNYVELRYALPKLSLFLISDDGNHFLDIEIISVFMSLCPMKKDNIKDLTKHINYMIRYANKHYFEKTTYISQKDVLVFLDDIAIDNQLRD